MQNTFLINHNKFSYKVFKQKNTIFTKDYSTSLENWTDSFLLKLNYNKKV